MSYQLIAMADNAFHEGNPEEDRYQVAAGFRSKHGGWPRAVLSKEECRADAVVSGCDVCDRAVFVDEDRVWDGKKGFRHAACDPGSKYEVAKGESR